ncbi:MAG TPA: UDP-N-acetylglucosamine 2-epimerase (non-hydrolyzing) [Saprospiraceae bacterium]|mgnify:CR=1 FL=1|nr:UDP-N-acetylglucosamine 2-epimerase (non-hydrolyzing) [Saprospiraceae bacterium]
MKLAIILGTRPEIIRLSKIILKANECLDLVLIHTGQNWDPNLSRIFFEELGLPQPKYQLKAAGKHVGETIGNIISRSYEILLQEKPDALLVVGDTNSCLSAISAKRLKIPVFHMEGGNRCFDMNVPEEINRILVDSIADINLVYTENSKLYLCHAGFTKDNVFITGSPTHEVLTYYKDGIEASRILEKLKLIPGKYLLASIHREENLDLGENIYKIFNALKNVSLQMGLPIVFSTHPRTRIKLNSLDIESHLDNTIHFIEAQGLLDYCKLIKNAYCFLSDSGTIAEEAVHFKIPAVTIRQSSERPEGVENGNIVVSGYDPEHILLSIALSRELPQQSFPLNYLVPDVSSRVLKIIASYFHIVNKRTWYK